MLTQAGIKVATPLCDLVRRLYPFNYALVGEGNDASIPVMRAELPFKVHEFSSGAELNGWRIPEAHKVVKAEIRKDGRLVYDGRVSPLGTIMLTEPFQGTIDLSELKQHLHYSDGDPDAVVFHCVQPYRPGQKTWGFCIPRRLFDSLSEGKYEVDIKVNRHPSTLKVFDYVLPGAEPETVVLQAHNCHPFQANDDISGIAVGISVLQRLASRPARRLTYRLIICPELTGTVFWLDSVVANELSNLRHAIILPAVGNDSDLKLQESFTGRAAIDRAARHVFRHRYRTFVSGPFRTIYGNDETVFEAPGFEIPTISLTRYPFAAYHTDRDTPEQLSEQALEDTARCVLDICDTLEHDYALETTHSGLYCLSDPRYSLYKPVWDPSNRAGPKSREEGRHWNLLMTCLPRLMDGRTSLVEIADRFELPIAEVAAYAKKWVDVGLAKRVIADQRASPISNAAKS